MTDVATRDDGTISLPSDASSEEKIAYAHRLRLSGKSWREIGLLCEYASDDVARLQVKMWLQKAAIEVDRTTRSEHLVLELERLDSLQSSVWDDAVAGDKKSMDSVLRIVQIRSRLLGLDNITTEVNSSIQTIVVTQEEYVQRLKTIAGEHE
jgi:hypothetical protein